VLATADPAEVDIVLAGALADGGDLDGLVARLTALRRPLILRTTATQTAPLDRLLAAAGFQAQHRLSLLSGGVIGKWLPGDPPAPVSTKRVLVLSYFNTHNFGDRLGYHLINDLLPAHAEVTHAAVSPWQVEERDYDLIVVGIGNSLNAPTMRRPELHRLVARARHAIGIFGTQYPYQYREMMDPALFDSLLDGLTSWWARYEEDIRAFGRGRDNVRHLGDWLISAFPMAEPTLDKALVIPPDFVSKELSLDRTIQKIQAYRRVRTARIHPMLCALTSAAEVAYEEQREGPDKTKASGKFRAQLYDIFGRSFDEGSFFRVDRDAVLRYKMKVEANMADLRAEIATLLA